MFIVALFTNMEIWKQPHCLLIDQGQAYLEGYYRSALKKERNSYIKCHIDEPSRHCARWNELVTQGAGIVWLHWYEVHNAHTIMQTRLNGSW